MLCLLAFFSPSTVTKKMSGRMKGFCIAQECLASCHHVGEACGNAMTAIKFSLPHNNQANGHH